MADEFFATASSTFAGYNITDDQIATLKACIGGDTAPADAAKRLTTRPAASSTPLEVQQRLGGLWTLLNDAAVAVPSAQPAIVSILQTIRTFPKVELPKGEGEAFIDLDEGNVWRELTGWANDWADDYNHHAARFTIEPSQGRERSARKAAWVNANAYTARLAATGDPALASYGAALDRASRVIFRALEFDHGGKEPDELEAAAQLFKYAASELYSRCRDGYPVSGSQAHRDESGKHEKGARWRGGGGFSMERWEFWKRRWVELASLEGLSEQARAASGQALQAMEEAEA
ncbi:hypothetical protein DL770_008494 [Monosporascus sp. CRB-9-2]|nr:hypothetical protein DL770_008494 [Monosporascus sp. CRB-9-2]